MIIPLKAGRVVVGLIGAAFLHGGALHAQTNRILVRPTISAGAALIPGQNDALGSFGVELERDYRLVSASVVYRRSVIGRSCKESLPPQCSVSVPSGHMAAARIRIPALTSESFRLLAGPEAGAVFWRANDGKAHRLFAVAGTSGELQLRVGAGQLAVGGFFLWTDPVSIAGVSLGLGLRL